LPLWASAEHADFFLKRVLRSVEFFLVGKRNTIPRSPVRVKNCGSNRGVLVVSGGLCVGRITTGGLGRFPHSGTPNEALEFSMVALRGIQRFVTLSQIIRGIFVLNWVWGMTKTG